MSSFGLNWPTSVGPVDGGEVLAHRYKAVWGIATGSCQATGDDEDTKDTGDADGSSPRRSPVRAGGQTTVEHKGRRQVVPIWE